MAGAMPSHAILESREALAQGRHGEGKDVQAIIQILPESRRLHSW
jgi:hypothetical protein